MSVQTAYKLETIRAYAQFCEGNGTPAFPLEVFLEVSNICDLKCAMCWQFSALNTNRFKQLKSQDRGFLETETISANLATILNGALLVHCFGFGEPTIHPQFRTIVEQVTAHGAMCDFYTNGMHLDQDLCDFLVDRQVLQIIISFSGATKDVYESIYIGGDFDQVQQGIRRLAATKKAKGSAYPVIHVNSIGFNDHVAAFDDFTLMMARNGVNAIILSQLNVHADIPYLHEHVSALRPLQEGVVLGRAKALAAEHGVTIDASGYERHAAATTAEDQQRRSRLRKSVEPHLAAKNRTFGQTPIQQFRQIARELPIVRDPAPVNRAAPDAVPLGADAASARAALKIEATPHAGAGDDFFHCMEPFKTLYVTRNGAAKPCCFSSTDLYLGNLGADRATNIWRGAGYDAIRAGIANREYPALCVSCLKNKSAPEYYIPSLVDRFLAWNAASRGPALQEAIAKHAPTALSVIRAARPATLMAHARRRTQQQASQQPEPPPVAPAPAVSPSDPSIPEFDLPGVSFHFPAPPAPTASIRPARPAP